MNDDDRARLRQECQEDLDALRGVADERTFVLLERILARLTRLEVGGFTESEAPTKPAKRFSSTETRAVNEASEAFANSIEKMRE